MLLKQEKIILRYICIFSLAFLIIFAQSIFAREKAGGKGNQRSSSTKANQVKRSTPAQTRVNRPAQTRVRSTANVNRSSTIRQAPARTTQRSSISAVRSRTNVSNRTSVLNNRNNSVSISRPNISVQRRVTSQPRVQSRSIRSTPNVSIRSFSNTPKITTSTRSNVKTNYTSPKVSLSRSSSINSSVSSRIGRNIGSTRVSVSDRRTSATGGITKSVVNPQRTKNISTNIGAATTAKTNLQKSSASRGRIKNIDTVRGARIGQTIGNVKVMQSGQQKAGIVQRSVSSKNTENIGSVIGRGGQETIKKDVGGISKTNNGRGSIKKSRIGQTIGDKNISIIDKQRGDLKKSREPSGEEIAKDSTGADKRRIVLKKAFDERKVNENVVKRGDDVDSRDKNVIDRRKVNRGGSSEDSTAGEKAPLIKLPELKRDQNLRERLERRPNLRDDDKIISREKLEQRRRDKGIVVKNLEYRRGRKSSSVIYHDRPYDLRHIYHNEHIYRDRYNRLSHRMIWPRYHFWVNYRWGHNWSFCYVHPYYHRKYIFVSLNGYWPLGYSHMRYYWYPWHVYRWYGYYPVAREIVGDRYNYYTYNYYNYYTDDSAAGYSSSDIQPVDHTTFADVRAKLAQQAEKGPGQQTLADKYFEEAVKAFELGAYGYAADKFAEAMELATDDMILPFAYVQSLFAVEKYPEAAEVLREALAKISVEKDGVFYPRGLYPEDDILFEQIDKLSEKAKLFEYDADLQLLLGYQLLGLGETDEAEKLLLKASQDMTNAPSAIKLLELLAKIREQEIQEAEVQQEQKQSSSSSSFIPMMGFIERLEQWKSLIYQNWLCIWFWQA